MLPIVPKVRLSFKEGLCKLLRGCHNVGGRSRYLIVLNLLNGRSAYATAEVQDLS